MAMASLRGIVTGAGAGSRTFGPVTRPPVAAGGDGGNGQVAAALGNQPVLLVERWNIQAIGC